MGGGDLNMKKHFHPLTQENLERVWKAEEKKKKEDERIETLQQEIAIERQKEAYEQQAIESGLKKKKKEKLDWMYSGQQTVDTEAYLLGKKIDKNVDVGKEEEEGLSSGKTASSSTKSNVVNASDVLAKIKEDPLFLIKKKEEDNKKYLMANTIKMRKMRELIEEGTKSEKRSKKHKKNKKKKYESSSSSEDSSEDDSQRKRKKVVEKSSSHRREHGEERTHNRSYEKEKYRNRAAQPRFYNDRAKGHNSSSDEEERLEAQRNAMMNNAKWRQSQREKHTKSYHREKEAEEKDVEVMLKKSSTSEEKAYFVQKMQKDSLSAKGATVEDRIHRNIHSKQRTNAALSKKFTSR